MSERAPEVPGYRILAPLGVGANGPVWSARSLATGDLAAVKLLPRAGGDELAALRGVRHPHVIGLVEDIELPDGRLALVLEAATGGSLGQVVQARGHLTAGETVTVLTALAGAVAELHQQGVVHGDLSPANVVFQADGRPMLCDLGGARIAGMRTVDRSGTAGFVDPAVLLGAEVGPAADVYALGGLGWYCLVGAPPEPDITGRGTADLADACPAAPVALVAAVDAAMAPDPAHRCGAGALARAAYDSTPPEPLLLVPGPGGAGLLTRRLSPPLASPPQMVEPDSERRWWRRLRRGEPMRRSSTAPSGPSGRPRRGLRG